MCLLPNLYYIFRNVIVLVATYSKSCVSDCIYRTPGACSSAYLEDFLFFSGFLSSLTSSFFICGDFYVHLYTWTQVVVTKVNFLTCLTLSTLSKVDLDLLYSQGDSAFISNVQI